MPAEATHIPGPHPPATSELVKGSNSGMNGWAGNVARLC